MVVTPWLPLSSGGPVQWLKTVRSHNTINHILLILTWCEPCFGWRSLMFKKCVTFSRLLWTKFCVTFFGGPNFCCILSTLSFSEFFSWQQIIKPEKLYFVMIFVLFWSRFFTLVSLKYFIISMVDFEIKPK